MPSGGALWYDSRVPRGRRAFQLLLEASTLDEIESFFKTTKANFAYIVGVADGQTARCFEWPVFEVKRRESHSRLGLTVLTNHFTEFSWGLPRPDDKRFWMTRTRRQNLLTLAKHFKGSINDKVMKDIMDTRIEDLGATTDMTVYQLVVVPERYELWFKLPGRAGLEPHRHARAAEAARGVNHGQYYVVFDCGTMGTKTAIYSLDATRVAEAYRENKISYPKPGWAEMDANGFVENVREGVRECISKSGVNPAEIRAITASGIICGIVGIDEEWAARHPRSSHTSTTRAAGEAAYVRAHAKPVWVKESANAIVDEFMPPLILRWFLNHYEGFREKAVKVVNNGPFVLGTLAGLRADERSSTGRLCPAGSSATTRASAGGRAARWTSSAYRWRFCPRS